MGFREIELQSEYRLKIDDAVRDFYIPVLKESILYKRVIGSFSSSALVELSSGLCGLIKNGGHIQLIASPRLLPEDIDAVKEGILSRDDIIQTALIRALKEPKEEYERERLNLISNLIVAGLIDIKIAFVDCESSIGVSHERVGLMIDSDMNAIMFSDSRNDSFSTFNADYETIDVYTSWSLEQKRVEQKKSAFDALWTGRDLGVIVKSFPAVCNMIVYKYRLSSNIDISLDDKEYFVKNEINRSIVGQELSIPSAIIIRDYQKEAINNWKSNGYRGIFDMATGTGKTITALAAIVELYKNRKTPLAIFIVCPYQHLVNQWVNDIISFGMKPIVCHSASEQKNWRARLRDGCLSLELGLRDYICAVFTNATYSTEFVQKVITQIKRQAVLVVDEAHNFGAEKLRECLDKSIPFRLALSATLDRQGDEEGTNSLYSYFEKKCIEYTLKKAIAQDMLVRYYYHPIIVSFSPSELEGYIELTKKIGKALSTIETKSQNDYAKSLILKRARLIAAAQEKIIKLLEIMNDYKNEDHILVYCGATTMRDTEYEEGKAPEVERRQVDVVTELLGNRLNMKVAKFTAEETAVQRDRIKKEFDEGNTLQALIAIRCLDEGINIPSIRKAFILASSTNPKEYIQRRGRVLRKFKGKEYADIFDFILSPIPVDKIMLFDKEIVKLSRTTVKNEIIRMRDFANLAENSSDADECVFKLLSCYGLNLNELETEEKIG